MATPDPFDLVRERLAARGALRNDRNGRFEACCPAHDDSTPSLSVTRGTDQPVVLRCHAGCRTDDVLGALGLKPADVCSPATKPERARRKVVATYPYTDEAGHRLFDVVRFDPKGFAQRTPDGAWGINGVRRVLYQLPRVLEAVAEGTPVYVVEGEKDVAAAERAGLVATTNPGGAGKWRPEYNEALSGAEIVIVADCDDVGEGHARSVAAQLADVAGSVRVVSPAGGKDLADHLGQGLRIDQLVEWNAGTPATSSNGHGELRSLASVTPEAVRWLWPGRLPLGKLVTLDGDPGQGKSTLALDLAARVSTGSPMPDGRAPVCAGDVIVMSAEDGLSDTIRPRVEAAGGDVERVHAWSEVHDTDPDGEPRTRTPTLPGDIDRLARHIVSVGARLVIVDVFMAYLDSRVNAHHDQDVRQVLHRLMLVAERTGCVMVVLRHLNKSGGGRSIYRGGGSIGIVGAARVGMVVADDPGDESRNVLAVAKSNLAALPPALAYRLVPAEGFECARVEWLGPTHHTADALMVAPTPGADETAPRATAEAFLLDLLAEGALPVQDVKAQAIEAGLSWRTVRRAQEDLRIVPRKRGKPGDREQWWDWALPDPEGVHEPEGVLRVTRRTTSDQWPSSGPSSDTDREPQLPLNEGEA